MRTKLNTAVAFSEKYGAYLIIFFFSISYILLVLHRYWQFQYFFTDSVYFQKVFWQVARFQAPIVDHKFLGRVHIFGDHFHPTIFILSLPLLFMTRHEFTQLAMIVPLSISLILATKVGTLLIRNAWILMAIIFASFAYLGTQHAMIFGFHEVHLVPLFFWIMLYGYFFKKSKLYVGGLILLLLTKETMAMVVFCWGLFLLISGNKKHWRHAVVIMSVALCYFFVVTRVIIPHFSTGYLYASSISLPHNIPSLINLLIVPKEKIGTFLVSMASFGFLPLLNPATLLLVIQDFFVRYLFPIPGNIQYTLEFHYGIALVPLLTFSSIWTVHIWQKRTSKIILCLLAFLIIGINLVFHLFYHGRGPLQQVYIPAFYSITKDNAFLWELVTKVPKTGKIATMNHLGFALADRDVHPLPTTLDQLRTLSPDYVVYDKREEQSPANILPFTSFDDYINFINQLEDDKDYSIYFSKGTLRILQKVQGKEQH
ncbi:DUF2079 domain-containing protein [Candidatus Woesebacteria bacterium]|nr:DUF2079 domain-containing protein [Candidatus Woesebacteria bacterium]